MVRLSANNMPRRPRFLCVWKRGLPNADYRVHENSTGNALTALMERVYWVQDPTSPTGYSEPPEVTVDLKRVLSKFRALICRRVGIVVPWTHEEFLDGYRGRKRLMYERGIEEIRRKPYSHKESILSTFQKNERFRYDLKPNSTPRLINPRSVPFNCRVGPSLKPMEHRIYAAIDSIFGCRTVAKGLNATQVADTFFREWGKYKDPVAHSFDCSHCEQHFRPAMLAWEHSVYLACTTQQNRATLAECLRDQLVNTGYLRTPGTTIKFTVQGNRASGDMNTAMGNVLCIVAMIYSCLGVTGYSLVDNGDDFIIITERNGGVNVNLLVPFFLSCGFTLRVEGSTDVIEKIRFCQAAPIDLGGGSHRMVRPPETLAKDMATYRDLRSPALRKAWLTSVGACGRALCSGVPIHHSVFKSIPDYGIYNPDLPLESGFFHLSKGLHDDTPSVSDTARVSYWRAFDISPGQQEVLENVEKPEYLLDAETPWSGYEWCGLMHKVQGRF